MIPVQLPTVVHSLLLYLRTENMSVTNWKKNNYKIKVLLFILRSKTYFDISTLYVVFEGASVGTVQITITSSSKICTVSLLGLGTLSFPAIEKKGILLCAFIVHYYRNAYKQSTVLYYLSERGDIHTMSDYNVI